MMNQVCLMKLSWKMEDRSSDLWCRVMQGVHGTVNFHEKPRYKNTNPGVWKAIFNIWIRRLGLVFGALEMGTLLMLLMIVG